MELTALIIAIIALAASVVAIIMARKNAATREVVKETQTKVVVDSPFTYDPVLRMYTLDGGIRVKGSVVALCDGNSGKEAKA